MGFTGATYPREQNYSATASGYIAKIRYYLGDIKEVKRDYVNSCYSGVMGDSYTYILENKGWPLKVTLIDSDGIPTEFTALTNPVVQGYQYVTFSGAANQITLETTLDLWYESFQYSDSEIYSVYTTVDVPFVPAALETIEMVLVASALELAEAGYYAFTTEAAIRVRDGDTEYDPRPAIQAYQFKIDWLKKKLEDLTKRDMSRIEGVRVE